MDKTHVRISTAKNDPARLTLFNSCESFRGQGLSIVNSPENVVNILKNLSWLVPD